MPQSAGDPIVAPSAQRRIRQLLALAQGRGRVAAEAEHAARDVVAALRDLRADY